MSSKLNNVSYTLSEYQEYILNIINRLHNENSLSLKENFNKEGKLEFSLEFRAPEWFRELNEDVQNVAFDNLQRIMVERVSKFASESGCVEDKGIWRFP